MFKSSFLIKVVLFVACCYNKCFPGVAAMSVPRMLDGAPATELKLVTLHFPVHALSFGKEQKWDPIFVIKTSCQVWLVCVRSSVRLLNLSGSKAAEGLGAFFILSLFNGDRDRKAVKKCSLFKCMCMWVNSENVDKRESASFTFYYMTGRAMSVLSCALHTFTHKLYRIMCVYTCFIRYLSIIQYI